MKYKNLLLKSWAIEQFGLEGAAVLCVLHRWTVYCVEKKLNPRDGLYGFVQKRSQFKQTFFWCSEPTVRRSMDLLKKAGLLRTKTRRGDPSWYAVDLDLWKQKEQIANQIHETLEHENHEMIQTLDQNDPSSWINMIQDEGGSQYIEVLSRDISNRVKVRSEDAGSSSTTCSQEVSKSLFCFGKEDRNPNPKDGKPNTVSLSGKVTQPTPTQGMPSNDVYKPLEKNKTALEVMTPERVQTSSQVPQKNPEGVSATMLVFWSYCDAYEKKYGCRPPQNAKQLTHCKQLCERLGKQQAIDVAAFYLSVPKKDYVEFLHPLSMAVKYCESLYAQMVTGLKMTASTAAIEDRDGHNNQVIQDALARNKEKFERSRALLKQKR